MIYRMLAHVRTKESAVGILARHDLTYTPLRRYNNHGFLDIQTDCMPDNTIRELDRAGWYVYKPHENNNIWCCLTTGVRAQNR